MLLKVNAFISSRKSNEVLFYGDCFVVSRNGTVRAPSKWTDYSCYRYTICHQSIFYDAKYLKQNRFDTSIKISACIIHYLNAYIKDENNLIHIPIVVCDYEGGGVSDSSKGRSDSLRYQYDFLKRSFGKKHYFYMFLLLLSGQLFKQRISKTPYLHSFYEKVSTFVYERRFK